MPHLQSHNWLAALSQLVSENQPQMPAPYVGQTNIYSSIVNTPTAQPAAGTSRPGPQLQAGVEHPAVQPPAGTSQPTVQPTAGISQMTSADNRPSVSLPVAQLTPPAVKVVRAEFSMALSDRLDALKKYYGSNECLRLGCLRLLFCF
jgi:hypothetical protein